MLRLQPEFVTVPSWKNNDFYFPEPSLPLSSWTRITKALGTRLDARLLFLSKLVPTVRENTDGNQ